MGDNSDTNTRKRLLAVGLTWLAATIIGVIAAGAIQFHPFGASREARIIDSAFDLLVVLSVPVVTFVLVMGGYSLIRDRDRGGGADGPPIRTNRVFITTWMVITTALSILVIITPGFSGLDELRAEPDAELVVDVRAERWNWVYSYPESGVETQGTLVLPIDTRILFRLTSTDVIHSFWVPAFRIKQDVVPGMVTTTMVTAEELGSFDNQDEMRVQCAELCGVGHARMFTGVEVVEKAEFDAWLAAAGG